MCLLMSMILVSFSDPTVEAHIQEYLLEAVVGEAAAHKKDNLHEWCGHDSAPLSLAQTASDSAVKGVGVDKQGENCEYIVLEEDQITHDESDSDDDRDMNLCQGCSCVPATDNGKNDVHADKDNHDDSDSWIFIPSCGGGLTTTIPSTFA
jgi:hypothetical protein